METSGKESGTPAIVLDTSAFIAGHGVTEIEGESYSVPAVRDELIMESIPRIRFENAVRTRRLNIIAPEPEHMEAVRVTLGELGEEGVLSEADTQILALGLQLGSEGYDPIIVSDDYAVQNVADRMGMEFRSLTTRGIKKRYRWTTYCPGCRRTFDGPVKGNVCTTCGTELKRRPRVEREIDRR